MVTAQRFRLGALALGLAAAVLVTQTAHAEDAEAVRRAAASFDAGSQAYRDGRFDVAAAHFESADQAVPSARTIRMAIRARAKAGQGARAATLAAETLNRYPDDKATTQLCYETLSAFEDGLHRLDVTCDLPCVLAVDSRAIEGAPRERWVIYVSPGEVTLSASFDGGGSDQQLLAASAGASNRLRFQSAAAPRAARIEPADKPAARRAGAALSQERTAMDASDDLDDGPSWIQSPAVFVVLSVATAGVGGVTIWSGVDALNNPGSDAVRTACVGQGTSCPAYQDGLAAQTRTNALIGATAGTALLTAVFGIFVTDWGSEDDGETVSWLSPSLVLGPDVAGLSLGGRLR